ncbi:unnamed protein product, partial [marine sediment metagenome]
LESTAYGLQPPKRVSAVGRDVTACAALLSLAVFFSEEPWAEEPWMDEPFVLRPPLERFSRRVRVWHVSLSWMALTHLSGAVEGVSPGAGWSVDAPEFALTTIVLAYGVFMGLMEPFWEPSDLGEGEVEYQPRGSLLDWFGSIPAGVWSEGREIWGVGSYEESYHVDEEEGGSVVYSRILVGVEMGPRGTRTKLSGLAGWSWHHVAFENRADREGSGPFFGVHFDWLYSRHFSIGLRTDLHYWMETDGETTLTTCLSLPLVLRW